MDTKLRQSAEECIRTGSAPSARGGPVGTNALTSLHGLASTPATASDALKLLHELQVHQVEWDLQHEQTEQELRQLREDLAHFTLLFDWAPFAYICLATNGVIIAANQKAAHWLAPEPGRARTWAGQRIGDLLTPESRAAVQSILAALCDRQTLSDGQGKDPQTCGVQSQASGIHMQAVVTTTPCASHVLMALMPGQP